MDGIVDAGMVGSEAAQQRVVRSIDDGIAVKGRDVPPPQHQLRASVLLCVCLDGMGRAAALFASQQLIDLA